MKPVIRSTFQVLTLVALAALSIYMMPKYTYSFKYHFEIGQPWAYGLITAENDFAIYKSDEQLANERKQVMEEYLPCYTFDSSSKERDICVISISEKERITNLGVPAISLIHNHVATTIFVENLYTPKTAYELKGRNMAPNLVYDSITSQLIEQNLLSSISLTQGMVQAGEKIIDTGEIVTEQTYQILESLRRSVENKNISKRQSLTSTIGAGLFIVIMLIIFGLYVYTYRRKLLDELRNMLFFTILMGIIITTAFLVLRYAPLGYIYLIPFAWGPIITRVFYDSRTAIFLHIITILIVSVAVPAPYVFVLLQVVGGVIAVISLRDMTQRAQLAQTALFTLIAYCVFYTAITMLMSGDVNTLNYRYYIYFAINSILVICSYGLIFLFERSFGLVSNITLVELTNVNSNLMLKFAEKAPGTFQHSLQVSNLATEAAKRIGAKVLLVRTGALYHDIGKMAHPEFFTENQVPGENPLLTLPYEIAAQKIIQHVIDGEQMARKHHLPEVIVHFIRSHHGTSMTNYFYNTAVNEARSLGKDVNDIDRSLYTYPGPKPATKEAAILMMADAIEARSRSLLELTPETINAMVDDMINQQMAAGQFADTPLSFKDLEDIRSVFKQKLMEMNHHRITYPTINK